MHASLKDTVGAEWATAAPGPHNSAGKGHGAQCDSDKHGQECVGVQCEAGCDVGRRVWEMRHGSKGCGAHKQLTVAEQRRVFPSARSLPTPPQAAGRPHAFHTSARNNCFMMVAPPRSTMASTPASYMLRFCSVSVGPTGTMR